MNSFDQIMFCFLAKRLKNVAPKVSCAKNLRYNLYKCVSELLYKNSSLNFRVDGEILTTNGRKEKFENLANRLIKL